MGSSKISNCRTDTKPSEDKPKAAYIETRPACPQQQQPQQGSASSQYRHSCFVWLRMIGQGRTISLLMLLLQATPANAERFTVRCANQGYYHVTFDTDSGRVVFESVAGLALKDRIESTAAAESSDSIRCSPGKAVRGKCGQIAIQQLQAHSICLRLLLSPTSLDWWLSVGSCGRCRLSGENCSG